MLLDLDNRKYPYMLLFDLLYKAWSTFYFAQVYMHTLAPSSLSPACILAWKQCVQIYEQTIIEYASAKLAITIFYSDIWWKSHYSTIFQMKNKVYS